MTGLNLEVNALRWARGLALAAAGILSLTLGVLLISTVFSTEQPAGSVFAWAIEGHTGQNEPLVVGKDGVLFRFEGSDGEAVPVSITSNSEGKSPDVVVAVTPENGSARVPLPAWFSGCQLVHFQTDGLPPLSAIISDGSAICPRVPQVRLFETLGVPTGMAPTNSVRDLLIYLRNVSSRADLNRLPDAYRKCLELKTAEISECLASASSGPVAGK